MGPAGLLNMNGIFGLEVLGPRKERYETVEHDVLQSCDVCVIGSGAAGAVLAKKLAEAGRSVIILEKGGYFEGEDMNQRDEEMMPLLFKGKGLNFTEDLRIVIAQGSCVGGSTVINDAVCFPIPEVVKRQWREMGVNISDDEWEAAMREVSDEIHINKVTEDELNLNSRLLRKGCDILGYEGHGPNDRNCVNCMRCGLCSLGCHYETKQDVRVTYIHKALNDPDSKIKIYCNCSAEKIVHSGSGLVEGVEGAFLNSKGEKVHAITVNAKAVIISAGAIASSHILLGNSIPNENVGKGLALHPSPFVMGEFPFEVRANQGIPMAYSLHQFGVSNGVEKGGFIIEGVYRPPLEFAVLVSRLENGRELMKRYNHFAMAGVAIRDHQNGTVSLSDEGLPKVSYSLGQEDLEEIAKGVRVAAEIWFAVNAEKVVISHKTKTVISSKAEIDAVVNAIVTDPDNLIVGSAHPQGGNRMGGDSKKCVVDSDCRVYGFENLFVCDASVFPTALGVNPQLTVMSLATIIAKRINDNWASRFSGIKIGENRGEVCLREQPMYCSAGDLNKIYEDERGTQDVESLVNSKELELIDGKNWTFDQVKLMVHNDRYWRGFFSTDEDIITEMARMPGGFWKRFWKADGRVVGEVNYYNGGGKMKCDLAAKAESIPELGDGICLQYKLPHAEPWGRILHYLVPSSDIPLYDYVKMVDRDTALVQMFRGDLPPQGNLVLSFSLSRNYGIDFVDNDDFDHIFKNKAIEQTDEAAVGLWEGTLVSDLGPSEKPFRVKYHREGQELIGDIIMGAFPLDIRAGFTSRRFETLKRFKENNDVMLGELYGFDTFWSRLFGRGRRRAAQDREPLARYVLRRVGETAASSGPRADLDVTR